VLVSILVLNWNGWRDTLECLASLDRLESAGEHHVLVIDNGSTDGSVQRLLASRPDLEVLATGENLGFGGGNNQGVRVALERGADFVWFLNNDTIVAPDALRALLEEAYRSEEIGLVGSRILREKGKLASVQAWGGGRLSLLTGRTTDFTQPVSADRIHFLTAASLLVKRAVLEETEGFDASRFFMYWEDVDLCVRARKLGWRFAVADDARVWHREGGSLGKLSPTAATYYNASAVRFLRRHCPWWPIPSAVGVAARVGRRVLRGDRAGIFAVARGAWIGLRAPLRECRGAQCP
jgi:GT2 family glycosyltransferase